MHPNFDYPSKPLFSKTRAVLIATLFVLIGTIGHSAAIGIAVTITGITLGWAALAVVCILVLIGVTTLTLVGIALIGYLVDTQDYEPVSESAKAHGFLGDSGYED